MGVKRQKKHLRGDKSVAEWSHNRKPNHERHPIPCPSHRQHLPSQGCPQGSWSALECRQKMLDDCRGQSGTSHHYRQRSPPDSSKLPTSTDAIPQLRRILDMLRLRRRTRRQCYPLLGMRLRAALTTHPNPPTPHRVGFLCPRIILPTPGKRRNPTGMEPAGLPLRASETQKASPSCFGLHP